MKMSNEFKVGLVILVALAIAFMYYAKTASFQTGTYELKTYFTFAGDLKKDAVVKLSGVEAGRLSDIKFVYEPETKVECTLLMNRWAKVRDNAIAYIGTSGFVGDAYIGLTPGTSETFLKNGGRVTSEDPVQMRILMKKADNIANNLDKILADVKTIVSENRQNIDNIVLNLESTTENFK